MTPGNGATGSGHGTDGTTAGATAGERAGVAPARLRFGIVLDGPAPNAWQAAMLEHLERSGAAELALVVVAEAGPARSGRSGRGGRLPAPPARSMAGVAFQLFATRLSRSKAMRPCDAVPWPDRVPVVHVPLIRKGLSTAVFRDEDVGTVRAHRPDVLVWLGTGDLAGGILEAARHGLWSFRHGDAERYPDGPLGFWEIVGGQPVVGATLGRLTASASGVVTLRRGWFATSPESYGRTRDRVLFGAAAWPAYVCREILLGASGDGQPSLAVAVAGPELSLRACFRFVTRLARARLRGLWHHGMRHDDWNVGVVDAPVATFLAGDVLHDVAWAPTRRGHYAADPFGRWDGTTLRVLYEDYSHARGAASIAHRRWSRERGWERSEPALEIGSHLSYPFLFEHEGRSFLLPESRATGKLVLYASADPGGPWQPQATLGVDGDIADATLLHHDGLWWMFAARPNRLNPSTELGIWYATRPDGPWREHPRNPVLVDVRSARPAGPVFAVDGQLYRPAQDCSTGYGDRLVIKRIVTLTTERFEEEAVSVVRPNPSGAFPYGVHTLTGVGPLTLVDGKRRVWDSAALARVIGGRLRR